MNIASDQDGNSRKKEVLWLLWATAGLSLLTTLGLPYIGEEGVYTVSTQEMHFHQSYLRVLFYGSEYGRPPLYHWLIQALTQWLGWDHIRMAARLVTVGMTLGSSLVLMGLVQALSHRRTLALLSAVLYLSGDLLFRRGWLAYADPCFSFFCFSAIACVWLAADRENRALQSWAFLLLGMLSVSLAFLSKAFTAYVFLFLSEAVLCRHERYRRFFFRKPVILIQMFALTFPLIWNRLAQAGLEPSAVDQANLNHGMWQDLVRPFLALNVADYGLKLFRFPFDWWLRFLPGSLVIPILIIAKCRSGSLRLHEISLKLRSRLRPRPSFNFKIKLRTVREPPAADIALTAGLIVLLNILPYWLAPEYRIRYLLPLYPFMAMAMACVIVHWQHPWNQRFQGILIYGLMASILGRFALGFWWFPWYERHYRGDYHSAAMAIAERVPFGHRIYTDNTSAHGISLVAELNSLRMPKAQPVASLSLSFSLLKRSEEKHPSVFDLSEYSEYLITDNPQRYPQRLILHQIQLGRSSLYLLKIGHSSLIQ